MGFVPGFENDIFISYAHKDNLPVHEVRWVERFHINLENRLNQLIEGTPAIWRDKRLDSNDQVNGQLDARINTSAILLTILSPSYFASQWCGWEREKFIESAERRAGLSFANKSRITKVVKTLVDFNEFPAELKETLGCSFVREDKSSGRHLELKPGSDDYNEKFEELAQSLASLLKLFKDHVVTAPLSADKTIYLAETTSDLNEVHEAIHRAFEREYSILPHEGLPRNIVAPELEKKIRHSLQKAKLSVHLLGASYGFVPEDPAEKDRSIIRLQHEVAQERISDTGFKQIIWVPKGLEEAEATTAKQKAFIKELLADSEAQKGADVLRGDLEALKTRIDELMKPPPAPVINLKGNGSLASVYLICDNRDRDEAQAIEDFLYDQRCEVLPPLPEGSEAQFVQYHQESLRECDAFLVYYNLAGESWALMKKQEFLRLPGLRTVKPVLAKAFFITGEKTPPKERFRSNEALVIKHFDQFTPLILQPFVEQIRQAKSHGGAK